MNTTDVLGRRGRRFAAAVAAGAALAFCLAVVPSLPASAHIRVSAEQVAPGGTAQLTFTVPNESTTSAIVIVEVDVPIATPVPDALLESIPGWTGRVTKAPLAKPISVNGRMFTTATQRITWTSSAAQGIAPGGFQRFAVSAGPLPDVPKVALIALQTYSDGDVVRWDGADAVHPAPTLYVTGTAPASTGMTGMSGMGVTPTPASQTAMQAAVDPLPRVLSTVALVLAALAVGLVLFFGMRGLISIGKNQRRSASDPGKQDDAEDPSRDLIKGGVR